jgi:hypothetical protein
MKKKNTHPQDKKKVLVKKNLIGERLTTSTHIIYLKEPTGEPLIDPKLKSASERVIIEHIEFNKYQLTIQSLAKKNDKTGSFIPLSNEDEYRIRSCYPYRKIFVERGNGVIQELTIGVDTPVKRKVDDNGGNGEVEGGGTKAPDILDSAGNDYQIFVININRLGFATSIFLNRDNPAVRAIGVWKGDDRTPVRNKCKKFIQNCINIARVKHDIISLNLDIQSLDGMARVFHDKFKTPSGVTLTDIYGLGETPVKNYLIDMFFEHLFYKDNTRKEYSDEVYKLVSEIEKLTSKTAFSHQEALVQDE